MFTTPLSEVLRMVRKNSKNRRFTDAAKTQKTFVLNIVNNVYYSAFGGFADVTQKLQNQRFTDAAKTPKSEVLRPF